MSYANDALLQSQQCATVLHGHCKRGNLLVITVVAKTLPQQQPFQNRLSTVFNRDSITINKHTATGQTIRMNVRCVRIHAHTRIPSIKEIGLPSTAFSLSFFCGNKSEHSFINTHFRKHFVQQLCDYCFFAALCLVALSLTGVFP